MSGAKEWWQPIWTFAVHAVTGSGVFIVIASVSIGLNYAVRWLEGRHVGPILVYGLIFGEYLLFFADLLLFIIFVSRTAYRCAKEL